MKKLIRGRIIRVVDPTTVVINLGRAHGIVIDSVFAILGSPETVRDPVTLEELGVVSLIKGKVKASKVSEKFTIATSQWTVSQMKYGSGLGLETLLGVTTEKAGNELRVRKVDLEPWKAVSEEYVQVGDEVDVFVETGEEEEESTDKSNGEVDSEATS